MMQHLDDMLEQQRAVEVRAQPLEADVAAALSKIGLRNPDHTNDLHKRLVLALRRTRGESWGEQVVAMKFEFNWELESAGQEYAAAKVDFEHYLDRSMTLLLAEPKMSVAKATVLANGADEAYRLKLRYLSAEQRERFARKFLETLQSALDNFRTKSADARAGDAYHARSAT